MATTCNVLRENGSQRITWTLGDADTGTAVQLREFNDNTVHVSGTFGSSTVTLQGSNDNSNWQTLHTIAGASLAFTASGINMVLEAPVYVRAISSGGTGAATTVIFNGTK